MFLAIPHPCANIFFACVTYKGPAFISSFYSLGALYVFWFCVQSNLLFLSYFVGYYLIILRLELYSKHIWRSALPFCSHSVYYYYIVIQSIKYKKIKKTKTNTTKTNKEKNLVSYNRYICLVFTPLDTALQILYFFSIILPFVIALSRPSLFRSIKRTIKLSSCHSNLPPTIILRLPWRIVF